jgi:quinol monooxygenase YgiN
MSKLTIVADIIAHPEEIDSVKAALERLLPTVRAEEGCIQYDLHQDNENPAHFLIYENWESRELWQNHMNAPHVVAHQAATGSSVADFALHEMTGIG